MRGEVQTFQFQEMAKHLFTSAVPCIPHSEGPVYIYGTMRTHSGRWSLVDYMSLCVLKKSVLNKPLSHPRWPSKITKANTVARIRWNLPCSTAANYKVAWFDVQQGRYFRRGLQGVHEYAFLFSRAMIPIGLFFFFRYMQKILDNLRDFWRVM
jgi:hypothetical protein